MSKSLKALSYVSLIVVLSAGCASDDGAVRPVQNASSSPVPTVSPQPQPAAPSTDEVTEFLRQLPPQLESELHAGPMVAAVPSSVGTASSRSSERWDLELKEPISAQRLAQIFGWAHPMASSGDVHQRNFSIGLYDRTIDDQRVALRTPKMGRWMVRAWLADRPQGPLPPLVAGASPAYDLEERDALVTRISFVLPLIRCR